MGRWSRWGQLPKQERTIRHWLILETHIRTEVGRVRSTSLIPDITFPPLTILSLTVKLAIANLPLRDVIIAFAECLRFPERRIVRRRGSTSESQKIYKALFRCMARNSCLSVPLVSIFCIHCVFPYVWLPRGNIHLQCTTKSCRAWLNDKNMMQKRKPTISLGCKLKAQSITWFHFAAFVRQNLK